MSGATDAAFAAVVNRVWGSRDILAQVARRLDSPVDMGRFAATSRSACDAVRDVQSQAPQFLLAVGTRQTKVMSAAERRERTKSESDNVPRWLTDRRTTRMPNTFHVGRGKRRRQVSFDGMTRTELAALVTPLIQMVFKGTWTPKKDWMIDMQRIGKLQEELVQDVRALRKEDMDMAATQLTRIVSVLPRLGTTVTDVQAGQYVKQFVRGAAKIVLYVLAFHLRTLIR